MSNENNITVSSADMESDTINESVGQEEADQANPRVSIHIHSVRKRLTDADGISAKAAIDGIVLAGLLQTDSPKQVKSVTYSQEKGEPEETIIEILE